METDLITYKSFRILSVDERIKAYNVVLNKIEERRSKNEAAFLCHALSDAVMYVLSGDMNSTSNVYSGTILEQCGMWDELVKYKPHNASFSWFKSRDYDARIEIVNKILVNLYREAHTRNSTIFNEPLKIRPLEFDERYKLYDETLTALNKVFDEGNYYLCGIGIDHVATQLEDEINWNFREELKIDNRDERLNMLTELRDRYWELNRKIKNLPDADN